MKCWAGWITSWNEDSWEKCQQPQIPRWYHSNCRKWWGTKEPLDESEWEQWKSLLETQHSKNWDSGIQSHHFMADRRGKVEAVTDFLFLGSKITVEVDCSCEIKRLLGRKAMINLDSVLKSRDITLPTNFHLVKAMVFLVVIYGCVNWTIKKAECQRIDAFELRCWRRLSSFLHSSWTRRSNQSILKQINPEYSLQGLILKL